MQSQAQQFTFQIALVKPRLLSIKLIKGRLFCFPRRDNPQGLWLLYSHVVFLYPLLHSYWREKQTTSGFLLKKETCSQKEEVHLAHPTFVNQRPKVHTIFPQNLLAA